MNPYKIIIDNIPAPMWAHMVNGFFGTSDAYEKLTMEEQQQLVGEKLIEFATSVAKGHAVNMAQILAARNTANEADALIVATKQVVTVTVEEVGAQPSQ